jgi:hypothetical protein
MSGRIPLAIGSALLLAGACGGGSTGPSSTGIPASPSLAQTSSGPELVETHAVLFPGKTYTTPDFVPRITFTVRDPWWVQNEDSTSIILNPGTSDQPEENVVVLDVERVFEPSNQRVPVKAPQDLVGWFSQHPGLKFIVKPHPVEIGGVRGSEFDVEPFKPPPCPSNPNLPPGTRCWLIAPFRPGDPFSPAEAAMGPPMGIGTTDRGTPERGRTDLFDVQGHHVLIGFGDYQDSFGSTVRLFEQLIETIRFG